VVPVSEHDPASTPSSFAALYHASYGEMVRLAHLLTGSNEAAEELVQDAFLAVYGRIDELANPGGYLRSSVMNGCRSWHRRRYLERRTVPKLFDRPDSSAPGRELVDALTHLPFRQRAAVVLRYYEDCSTDEIAAALQCRPGTAKSLVSRGIAKLREVVGDVD
jgi:RNA polymerase sigma-70 factor (sigma-E family)